MSIGSSRRRLTSILGSTVPLAVERRGVQTLIRGPEGRTRTKICENPGSLVSVLPIRIKILPELPPGAQSAPVGLSELGGDPPSCEKGRDMRETWPTMGFQN